MPTDVLFFLYIYFLCLNYNIVMSMIVIIIILLLQTINSIVKYNGECGPGQSVTVKAYLPCKQAMTPLWK